MKSKINYHYTISFKPVYDFKFIAYTNTIIVDEECYAYRVLPYLDTVKERLKNKPNSRQEVIVTHKQFKNDACLISIQFLIVKNKLILIANFRSQCAINGRPNDTQMLRHFATLLMNDLGLKKFKIYVNVAQYHKNLGSKNNYGLM